MIGEVIHYYSKIGVAALNLQAPLRKGDLTHILGHMTDLVLTVDSLEMDHSQIDIAQPGDDVAIKVLQKVREGDKVYRVMD